MLYGESFVEKILNLATDENVLGFLPAVTKCFRFSANCKKNALGFLPIVTKRFRFSANCNKTL